MDTPTTLIQLLLNLLSDPKVAAEFQQNPSAFLASCGLADVSTEQVHDAAVLVADQHTPKPHHGGGDNGHDHHHPTPPAPEPAESVVKYLQTIVTNNWIDDRDTIVDNSIHQNIHADGDVNQVFDNDTVIASGDGSVAAGGDIRDSTVTTGDGNAVGDHNVVGDDNATAFGNGDANHATISDTTVEHGSALTVGGAASGADTTTDSFNDTSTSTSNTSTTDHSFNESATIDTDVSSDSHNETNTNVDNHNDFGSHNAVDVAVS